VKPSDVCVIHEEMCIRLREAGHTIGYLVYRRLPRVIKQRLVVHRTEQLLHIIRQPPDMTRLLAQHRWR